MRKEPKTTAIVTIGIKSVILMIKHKIHIRDGIEFKTICGLPLNTAMRFIRGNYYGISPKRPTEVYCRDCVNNPRFQLVLLSESNL